MIYIYLIFLLIISTETYSQEFYLDAITFKNESNNYDGKCDLYIIVPYSILKFENNSEKFYSSFSINTKVYDSNNSIIFESNEEHGVVLDNFYESQGGNGGFKIFQKRIDLVSGEYKIDCIINDKLSNVFYKRTTDINILEFDQFPFTLSGLMILSSIEEVNGKFKITPYINSNISKIKNGFFVFLEYYTQNFNDTSFKLYYELHQIEGKKIIYGNTKLIENKSKNQQNYFHIKINDNLIGKYTIKVFAIKNTSNDSIPLKKDYLAITQKVVDFTPSLIASQILDIDKSIKQMKYVADNEFYESIKDKTNDEKIYLFLDFWNKLDPSPNTEKNEAFIEYFSRVEYANKNFKSFSDGWITDKGQVYIVFGEPLQIIATNSNNSNRVSYEIWQYNNNLEFVFMDKSGFGDFRLIRPISVTQKYSYNK